MRGLKTTWRKKKKRSSYAQFSSPHDGVKDIWVKPFWTIHNKLIPLSDSCQCCVGAKDHTAEFSHHYKDTPKKMKYNSMSVPLGHSLLRIFGYGDIDHWNTIQHQMLISQMASGSSKIPFRVLITNNQMQVILGI